MGFNNRDETQAILEQGAWDVPNLVTDDRERTGSLWVGGFPDSVTARRASDGIHQLYRQTAFDPRKNLADTMQVSHNNQAGVKYGYGEAVYFAPVRSTDVDAMNPQVRSGNTAIYMPTRTPSITELELRSAFIRTRAGVNYRIRVRWRSSVISKQIRMTLVASHPHTDLLQTATVSYGLPNTLTAAAANTWQYDTFVTTNATNQDTAVTAPPTWGRITFHKLLSDWDCWVDEITVEELPIAFSAHRTTGQTATAGIYNIVAFEAVQYNYTDTAFSLSTSDFIVKEPGLYHFDGGVGMPSEDQRIIQAALYVNGTQVRSGAYLSSSGANNLLATLSCDQSLARGDIVTFRVYNGNAVDKTLLTGPENCYFQGRKVG